MAPAGSRLGVRFNGTFDTGMRGLYVVILAVGCIRMSSMNDIEVEGPMSWKVKYFDLTVHFSSS